MRWLRPAAVIAATALTGCLIGFEQPIVFGSASALAGEFVVAQQAAPTQTTLDPAEIAKGLQVWKRADCASCHGWAGNGQETAPIPPAPSLRATTLDYDAAHQTIQCGRPATEMPSHDRLAYTDTRCYGLSSADVGKDKPTPGTPLRPDEIDAVTAYVVGYLKGRGAKATRQECEQYYGPAGASTCTFYPVAPN